jgi:hypothetical protein
VLVTERELVGVAVRHLDPGPGKSGCMTLMVLLVLTLLGWLS